MSHRIVVDTNVLVSALLGPAGQARQLLRGCLAEEYEPQMGNALYAEYESLLRRPLVRARCRLSPEEVEVVFDAFMATCRWVEVYFLWRPNLPDEGDNHVLELAIASGADVLVTQNARDFRRSELKFDRPRILRPAELLKEARR